MFYLLHLYDFLLQFYNIMKLSDDIIHEITCKDERRIHMNISISGSYRSSNIFNLNYKNKKNVKNNEKKGQSLKIKNKEIENLQKQKQNLIDSKQKITERGLKKKEDPLEIEKQLKDVDKQIESIDKQISVSKLKEQEKGLNKNDKDKASEKQKTEGQSQNDKDKKVSDEIFNSSGNLRRNQIVSSQRVKMMGRANVLKYEIKEDEARGVDPKAQKQELGVINDSLESINVKFKNKLNKQEKVNKNAEDKNTNISIQEGYINKYKDNDKTNEKCVGEKIDSAS